MSVYWIWFAQLRGISLFEKHKLLQKFHSPQKLFVAAEAELCMLSPKVRAALSNPSLDAAERIVNLCRQSRIGILSYADESYPQNLRNIEDPPLILYYKGTLPDWTAQPLIGVVGTRKASPYGLQTTEFLAAQIAACGGMIVSGVAAGIDTVAMEAGLGLGKPVVGVLGCGVDVVYPSSNRTLYRRTEKNGCLLSEYPPGSRPYPGNFLRRNRIISGISQGVLVVEAPERSGALSTARHAFAQGRDVFTVPANLGVESSKGSNGLLHDGAYAVLVGWDVMQHYAPIYPNVVENHPLPAKMSPEKVAQVPADPNLSAVNTQPLAKNPIDNTQKSTYSVINKQPAGLSKAESDILALLGAEALLIDSILDAANLPYGTVQSILTRLTIQGVVIQHPDGRVSRK